MKKMLRRDLHDPISEVIGRTQASAGALSETTPAKTSSDGLTSEEAESQLAKVGPNAMPDAAPHPLRQALAKLWAPVPWMLEAAIVLELVLHKFTEAAIIAGLLIYQC